MSPRTQKKEQPILKTAISAAAALLTSLVLIALFAIPVTKGRVGEELAGTLTGVSMFLAGLTGSLIYTIKNRPPVVIAVLPGVCAGVIILAVSLIWGALPMSHAPKSAALMVLGYLPLALIRPKKRRKHH